MSPNTQWTLAAAAADPGGSLEWPTVVFVLGLVFLAFLALVGIASTVHENRKLRITAAQEDAVRKLVDRYEKLAATTLDAQQRVAADTAEVRSRLAAIEQLLRSVE